MADQKMSEVTNTILVRPGVPNAEIGCTVGDGDELPGHVVTGLAETHPEVDLCAAAEEPMGVLKKRPELDIDTVISATEGAKGVRVVLVGSGAIVWVFYEANGGNAKAGQYVKVGTEDGKVVLWDTGLKVGKLLQDVTNDATNDQCVKIILVGT